MKLDLQKLADIKENILNWYPFKEESSILQIGEECNQITELLNKKCKIVKSIKTSREQVEGEFDYCLINSAEEQQESLEVLLKYANTKTKDDGTILITTDNKFGLQNININITEKNLPTKKKIEQYAKETKFKNIKFYYPLPNYKLPNVIFTDAHGPSSESILRDLTIYDENDIIVIEERKKYVEIIKEDPQLFSFFANSYLVEISNSKDNEIELVTFGNSRKPEYRMITTMKKEVVEKAPVNEKSEKHLNQIKSNIEILKKSDIKILDEVKENCVQSKVVREAKTLDKVLIELAKEKQYDELIQTIKKYSEELTKKLKKSNDKENTVFEKYNIKISKPKKEKLNFVKYGLYDLIFQNAFCIDKQIYFYDQEWIEENIPFEFIMYRAINYLANSSKIIDRDELYSAIEITSYIKEFEKLEEILQKQIIDETIWAIHANNHTTIQNIKDTCTHYKNLKNIEIEKNRQKDEEIKQLNTMIQTREAEIQYMLNSKSWKITKPLRYVYKKIGKDNERNK